MTFDLRPVSGETVYVNGWNWRPTLELLRSHHVLENEAIDAMALQFCGTTVNASDAERNATFLDDFLRRLGPQDRVLLDGTITSEPDTFELNHEDMSKNYSATTAWLTQFRDFCRSSGGFEILLARIPL